MILEPQAVADLIGSLTGSLDARTADEGRSAFSGKDGKTRVGEALFSERLNLYSDPMHPEMPAAPATAEGIPASRLSLIKAGVLENLEYSRFWAQEKKRDATPGPVNYIMEGTRPPTSLDDMIEGMERGLVISRFWYVRLIDPPHDHADRAHPRRTVVGGEGPDSASGAQPAVQPERAGDAGAVERGSGRRGGATIAADGAGAEVVRLRLHVDLGRDLSGAAACRAGSPRWMMSGEGR